MVTLTHDPKLDDPALDRALKSPAFYIGALGSRRTHAARLKRLRELGHTDEAMARIQGPVGLNIEAVTAPEIALSIIAEIVGVRRGAPLAGKGQARRMKFGPAPLDEARGAIMAHSQRIGDKMIRKGALLDDAAIGALREAGRTEVICARLEPGDVPEDIAADRLARPLVSPLLARSRAATGRVNLVAEAPGLLRVDTARIDRLNSIDESLTIGTLPDYAVVSPKDLVATIKVIPFSVPGHVLTVAEQLARQGELAADPAPVHAPAGRPGRHRTAGPEGKRHRKDGRGDGTAGHRADRRPAAPGAHAA